ncbi:MAG TPA: hypothetical protein LFW14_02910 [Rickettsia endosymbiont of Degeeriella rufa]|nr:hypothetical protein [Rickettsia endosymbiont of Degeeriella rufa]
MYNRCLKLSLDKKQTAFLWGARKTGKSTYLKELYPNSIYYDLLKTVKEYYQILVDTLVGYLLYPYNKKG